MHLYARRARQDRDAGPCRLLRCRSRTGRCVMSDLCFRGRRISFPFSHQIRINNMAFDFMNDPKLKAVLSDDLRAKMQVTQEDRIARGLTSNNGLTYATEARRDAADAAFAARSYLNLPSSNKDQ